MSFSQPLASLFSEHAAQLRKVFDAQAQEEGKMPFRDVCDFIRSGELPPIRPDFKLSEVEQTVFQDMLPEFAQKFREAEQPVEALAALVDIVFGALYVARRYGFDFEEAWRRFVLNNEMPVSEQLDKFADLAGAEEIVSIIGTSGHIYDIVLRRTPTGFDASCAEISTAFVSLNEKREDAIRKMESLINTSLMEKARNAVNEL